MDEKNEYGLTDEQVKKIINHEELEWNNSTQDVPLFTYSKNSSLDTIYSHAKGEFDAKGYFSIDCWPDIDTKAVYHMLSKIDPAHPVIIVEEQTYGADTIEFIGGNLLPK
ncbi:hypothetical protein FACS1894137_04930 [Spirochaetia bacterium]|nr:hypothetical protein FACS1894137_04930 [Spirochaetia bacterium]